MPRVDDKTLKEIQGLQKEYEELLLQSNYTKGSQEIRRAYGRQFISWLASEWSPLDYDGSLSP